MKWKIDETCCGVSNGDQSFVTEIKRRREATLRSLSKKEKSTFLVILV